MVFSPTKDEETLPQPATAASSKGLRPALARVSKIGLSILPNKTDLGRIRKDKNKRFYRQHAPIWSLYIKDAAAQARSHADHWNTTLDTLLIFAGLFAGVVASFVIESRSDLQPEKGSTTPIDSSDSTNQSIVDFQPSNATLWVNGLWFASLLFTLFNAIVGGVAKTWLVKYASATSRQDSDAAYDRWILDQRARQWRLNMIVAVVPLVMHVALFLFFAGFALRTTEDHYILGNFAIGFLALAASVYLLMTIPPLFVAEGSSPLQTPLSDLINGIVRKATVDRQALSFDNDGNDTDDEDEDELPHDENSDKPVPEADFPSGARNREKVLARVWIERVIHSRNPHLADKGIEELNNAEPDDRWLEYFVRRGAVDKAISRLGRCMEHRSGYEDQESRNQVVGHHLRALLRFRSWAEDSVKTNSNDDTKRVASSIKEKLEKCLEIDRPLHLWNFFPKPMRPLAFALRIALHLQLTEDIRLDELDDQPWEALAEHARNSTRMNRLPFTLTACRGLLEGRNLRNLQEMCAFSIAFSVVNAAANGSTTEWLKSVKEGPDKTKETREETGIETADDAEAKSTQLGQLLIRSLFADLAQRWTRTIEDGLKGSTVSPSGTSNTGYPQDLRAPHVSGIPPNLLSSLGHESSKIRSHAIKTIEALASNPIIANTRGLPIAKVFERAIEDNSSTVRNDAVKCLGTISELTGVLPDHFPQIRRKLQSLANSELDINVLIEVLNNLRVSVLKHVPSLKPIAVQSLVFLIRIMVISCDDQVSEEVTQLIRDLNGNLSGELINYIKDLFNDDNTCVGCLEAFHRLSPFINSPLSLVASTMVPKIFNNRNDTIRALGRTTIIKVVKSMTPQQQSNLAVLGDSLCITVKNLLQDQQSRQDVDILADTARGLLDLVTAIPEILKNVMTELIPTLFSVFSTEAMLTVRLAFLKIFLFVAQEGDAVLLDHLESAARSIYQSINLARDDPRVRLDWVEFLGVVSLRGDDVDVICQLILIGASDVNEEVRSAALERLSKSFSKSNTATTIPPAIEAALKSAITSGLVTMGDTSTAAVTDLLMAMIPSPSLYDLGYSIVNDFLNKKPLGIVVQDQVKDSTLWKDHPLSKALESAEDWRTRCNIAKLLAFLARKRKAPCVELDKLANMVFSDIHAEVKATALSSISSLADVDHIAGLGDVLALLNPKDLQKKVNDKWAHTPQVRKSLVGFLTSFSSHFGILEVSRQVLDLATKDPDAEVRSTAVIAVSSLRKDHKEVTAPLLMTAISKPSNSVLKDPSPTVRLLWVDLIEHVIERPFDDYLWLADVVELSFGDEDQLVRNAARKLMSKETKIILQANLKDSVRKKLENALKSPDVRIRRRSLGTLRLVSFASQTNPFRQLAEIVLPQLVPTILSIALEDHDNTARQDAETLVLDLIDTAKSDSIGSKSPEATFMSDNIGCAILLGLPPFIGSITEDTKKSFLVLADKVDASRHPEKISIAGRAAARFLRKKAAHSRATAVKLLISFHRKCNAENVSSRFMDSTIMDVVGMVLDDKDDQLREDALRFLIKVCTDPIYLPRIKGVRPRLMELLEITSLRTPAAELISLLARDNADIRIRLASWIFSALASPESDQKHVEAAIELLSTLVMDGRLNLNHRKTGSLDAAMLLLASIVITRPSLANYKFHVSTALWLNYRHTENLTADKIPGDLVKWFLFMVFGNHATKREVNAWLDMENVIGAPRPLSQASI